MMGTTLLGLACCLVNMALLWLLPTVNSSIRNVTIGFLIDSQDPLTLSLINTSLTTWASSCCTNISITDVSVKPIFSDDLFQANVETYVLSEEKNVSVVVPSSCDVLPMIDSLAAMTTGTLVVMTPLYCWTAASIMRAESIAPLLKSMIETIHQFVIRAKWKEAVIYYDEENEAALSAILHVITDVKFKPINIGLMTDDKLLDTMVATHQKNERINQYMVLSNDAGIYKVFGQAHKFENRIGKQGFIDYYSEWLLLIEQAWMSGILTNITGINNVDAITLHPELQNSHLPTFVEDNLKTLQKKMDDIFFGRSSFSCEKDNCLHMHVVPEYIANRPVYSVLGALATYSSSGVAQRGWTEVATWSEGQGLQVQTISLFPARSYGFNNMTLKIGAVNRRPYMTINKTATELQDRYNGFCLALVKELAYALNFSFEITQAPDNSIGIRVDEAGNWNGLMNMLINKEIDLAVAPMAVTEERANLIDFTYPFHFDQYAILYKRIDPASRKYRLFVEPFKWPVWLGIGLSIFVSAGFVWLTSHFSPYYDDLERVGGLGVPGYALFYTYGALFQQGCVYEPRSLGARFVVGFWWFYCMCVVATYNGNLIAFLTVPMEFLPFGTMQELVSGNLDIKYGFIGNTGFDHVLKNSTVPMYMDFWADVQKFSKEDPTTTSTDVDVHINKVLEAGKYVFISDKTALNLFVSEYCGELNIFKRRTENIWMVQYAIAFPTGSTYPRLFSDTLLQFHEAGLIDTLRFRYFKKEETCTKSESLAKAVTLSDFFGPIVLFVGCITLCLAAFGMEHFYIRWNKWKIKELARKCAADPDHQNDTDKSKIPSTPEKKFPAGHDPYAVDPELLANTSLYDFGQTNFHGFYESKEFQRKLDEARERFKGERESGRLTSTSYSHSSTSQPSSSKSGSPSTCQSTISPVDC